MEPNDAESLRHALVQGWDLRLARGPDKEEALIEALAERVHFLLRHDLDRLMTGLYVLDVPEEQFRASLAKPDTLAAAKTLAAAIIAREKEKAATRERFRRETSTAGPQAAADLDEKSGGDES